MLCGSPGFLKLLSFDFANYRSGPIELLDSEMVWSALVDKHFLPIGDWSTESSGDSVRKFRCPQCGSGLLSRSQQYSINMWPTTTRPTDDRPLADMGFFLVGFKHFAGTDPRLITDFKLASDRDSFVQNIAGIG